MICIIVTVSQLFQIRLPKIIIIIIFVYCKKDTERQYAYRMITEFVYENI